MTLTEKRIEGLLSHRMRGFDRRDSTRLGLAHALNAGVRQVEFDVRFTRDGHPVAYHDPLFKANDGSWRYIHECDLAALRAQRSLSELATLDEMFAIFTDYRASEALLHVDVKVEGYESVVYETIRKFELLSNAVLVSWLPGVLTRFNAMSPQSRLCFSHLPLGEPLYRIAKAISPAINGAPFVLRLALRNMGPQLLKEASTLHVYFHDDGDPASWTGHDDGADQNLCHVVPGMLTGTMLNLLSRTRGIICVPLRFATQRLKEAYRAQGVQLAVFSVDSESALERVTSEIDPDIIYVDNANIFRNAITPESLPVPLRTR